MNTKRRVSSALRAGFVVFAASAVVAPVACGGQATSDVSGDTSEIIAGVPANGAKLNAIGSVGYFYEDPWSGQSYYSFYCSATLIGSQTVLTAKHCVEYFASDYMNGLRTFFAVGPDTANPLEMHEVVEVKQAPDGIGGGLVGYGHDVGVMHLGQPVTTQKPLALCELKESSVGKKLTAIGYGVQNNAYKAGTRRAGNVTVRALSGLLYPAIFGSFEAFKKWALTGEAPAGNVAAGKLPGIIIPTQRPLPNSSSSGDSIAEGVAGDGSGGTGGGGGGSGGKGGGGTAGKGGGGEGGSPTDPFEEYLREIYDTVALEEGYEALVGGAKGDAQPCYGDSGGPLLESKKNGQLVIHGVASGVLSTNQLVCDLGAIYATFGPEVKEFLNAEKDWVDPCEGESFAGTCSDEGVARRCTDPSEGPRRLVEFDCTLLGQVCAIQPDGTAGCSDPPEEE